MPKYESVYANLWIRSNELIWKLFMVPQQFEWVLPWLKENGLRWFASQLCRFLLKYGDLAHWGTWPVNHQWTQLLFELSDNFQWGKDRDFGWLPLLGISPVKICYNLMASFVLTTFHRGEYDVYILAMKSWLKYI